MTTENKNSCNEYLKGSVAHQLKALLSYKVFKNKRPYMLSDDTQARIKEIKPNTHLISFFSNKENPSCALCVILDTKNKRVGIVAKEDGLKVAPHRFNGTEEAFLVNGISEIIGLTI